MFLLSRATAGTVVAIIRVRAGLRKDVRRTGRLEPWLTRRPSARAQRYIYKRPQDQTDEQVFAHIDAIDARDPLTTEQWTALVGSACSHPTAAVVTWLASRGARPQDQLTELMRATVGSKERRLPWIERRIEVLAVLDGFRADGDTEPLDQALVDACWFGNIGPAAWLIEHGADIRFAAWNFVRKADVDAFAHAEVFGERFGDFTLRDYLRPYYESGTPLGDWRHLYDADGPGNAPRASR